MANIMRDIDREDTRPVAHCRLVLCMFVPFFDLDDLKSADESWPTAKVRVEQTDKWDKRTKPFRLNIAGMLRQRIAADEERANKEDGAAAVSNPSGDFNSDTEEEVVVDDYGNNEEGDQSVIKVTKHSLLTKLFVDQALDAFLSAGFSGDDSAPDSSIAALSGRTPDEVSSDFNKISSSSDATLSADMTRQEAEFKRMTGAHTASLANASTTAPASTSTSASRCDPTVMDPYLIKLRTEASVGLSPSAVLASDARRNRTNEEVAATDVGAVAASQHPVAFKIAQEFGLNRKQRLAFYLFANGVLAKKRSPSSEALRLYIGGGAGAGK